MKTETLSQKTGKKPIQSTDMQAGNQNYNLPSDLPEFVPVFPLAGALLLPGGHLPLNIFEPRYLAMVDDAIAGNRIIGIIQPELSGQKGQNGPTLCRIGCLGRLTGFQELGEQRMMIGLQGICRFSPGAEIEEKNGYRRFEISIEPREFDENADRSVVDRDKLLATFSRFLEANALETDWQSVEEMETPDLVNTLSMMSPYGPAEKQALLEAASLFERAETLIAITEIELAKTQSGDVLQ